MHFKQHISKLIKSVTNFYINIVTKPTSSILDNLHERNIKHAFEKISSNKLQEGKKVTMQFEISNKVDTRYHCIWKFLIAYTSKTRHNILVAYIQQHISHRYHRYNTLTLPSTTTHLFVVISYRYTNRT